MILNDVMAVLLRYFTEFGTFEGQIHVRHARWMKLDQNVCDKNVAQRIYFQKYISYSDILGGY